MGEKGRGASEVRTKGKVAWLAYEIGPSKIVLIIDSQLLLLGSSSFDAKFNNSEAKKSPLLWLGQNSYNKNSS